MSGTGGPSGPDEPSARATSVSTSIVLHPVGTPLPLGFLGLMVATLAVSALQLGWISPSEGHHVALAVLGFTVPAQLMASVMGFRARDPVAGTGMGVLAGTWAGTALILLTSAPGAFVPGLGVLLVGASISMLVPTVAATTKLVAAVVMGLSSLRFLLTGVTHLTSSSGWQTLAGWTGVLLAVVAFYAALGFELEDARHAPVLPLARRGRGARAVEGGLQDQLETLEHEAGVRSQL